ncbi:MAG TPA: 6,7-dimethyl-8-ribityllumazine synthase [Solirubrobacteraceae bacterium]|jgi:6,7-dimethyl-8-ribityllumazine synthase|nr:6,7-dimethyl-8-ribityllumazine synthase [Solirubrobacteraceae bacterium]
MRFAIVVGRFYEELADRLVDAARPVLRRASDEDVDVFAVPGAFELPLAALTVAQTGRYAGIACLGAVIRGETSHYDHVCAETARGIQEVMLRTGVPCGFGVLTVDTMEQALARAGGARRNQGEDAAAAVLALARIRANLA